MTDQPNSNEDYEYADTTAAHTQLYLWDPVIREIDLYFSNAPKGAGVFDLGCGNGALLAELDKRGYLVAGVDPSSSGIKHCKLRTPPIRAELGSAYDDLKAKYGVYPVVVSLEVVEHVYYPKLYAKTLYSLVAPGGITVVSTPYHGYLKNVALAVSGKMDSHFTALWDHGHIKFWSVRTLTRLLTEAGFCDVRFEFAGRTKWLAKSMIAIARRSDS